MSETDKANAPVDGAAPKGTTEPDVNVLRGAVEAATQRAAAAERLAAEHKRNYDNLHSAYGRQGALVGKYRDLYGDVDSPQGNGGGAPQDDSVPFTFAPEAADLAIVKFRQETPDWNEATPDPKTGQPGATLFDEAMALINDANRNAEFITFRADPRTGKPVLDFEASLRRAYKDVKLSRYEKSQAESREAQRALDARKNRMRQAAFISGEGATETAPGIDLSTATSDEILKAYPELANADDPPRALRNRR